jgi:hypothetical protein
MPMLLRIERIRFRIGINLGDVIVEPDDIFGDGVNIAARLEALAEPGGVCISRTVYDHIAERILYPFEAIVEQRGKNIARPVRAYCMTAAVLASLPQNLSSAKLGGPSTPSTTPCLAIVDQLDIYAYPVTRPPHAAFEDIPDAKLLADLLRVNRFALVRECGVARDQETSGDPGQIGGQVLGNAIREAFLLRIDADNAWHLWADRFDANLGEATTKPRLLNTRPTDLTLSATRS